MSGDEWTRGHRVFVVWGLVITVGLLLLGASFLIWPLPEPVCTP